ncbi:MAG: ATP-binding cassette domain-containing protein [Verrucomicrobia bacterium]|nr:ATP-binding cassette domain-containing protein [Verrucomicrobiota bacterium]
MIAVRNLSVRAGQFALNEISFEIPAGEYGFLMGKTGCGKTTVLEAICGLRSVVSGTIELMGRDVTRAKPAMRDIGFVPQDSALFSNMTVREHLSFALVIRKWDAPSIKARVNELAEWLGLDRLLDRKPAGLSGGEAQRVALGRALSYSPGILCMDEPLSALDEETRAEMCGVLESVRSHTGVTILHVSHSLEEAKRLADRILVLKDGQLHLHPLSGGEA